MNVICFDIGIHNFSFIISEVFPTKNKFNLKFIENKDLLPNTNVNKLTLDQSFFVLFHSYLKSIHSLLEHCNICLIERQLLSKKNFKACTIYNHLVAHLSIFFPKMKIQGFPSKHKYFDSYTKMNYKHRKNWGVDYVSNLIQSQKDDVLYDWLHTCFKKKDDICDCILMFISYCLRKGLLTKSCLLIDKNSGHSYLSDYYHNLE